MRDVNLKATEHFEAVARLGSVTRAAEELGVSPSAVSQQIAQLELQFGAKLFRREKRRLIPTLDGDRLFQTATRALGALRNAQSAIARERHARSLTIRVSPSFGVRWLGPRIAEFAAMHPDWNLRIDATPEFTSFETEAVDLDLRYGVGGWAGLEERCVMRDFALPLGAPGYLAELAKAGDTPAARLGAARLIDSVKTIWRWDLWLAANQIELPDLNYRFRFDRSSMAIEFARQGGALALDSALLCLGELERGDLAPFAPQLPVIEFPGYWFVCPQRHFNRRIVRLFHDWLAAECAAHEANVRALLLAQGCAFRAVDEPAFLSGDQTAHQ